jgi:hypothetical protein
VIRFRVVELLEVDAAVFVEDVGLFSELSSEEGLGGRVLGIEHHVNAYHQAPMGRSVHLVRPKCGSWMAATTKGILTPKHRHSL